MDPCHQLVDQGNALPHSMHLLVEILGMEEGTTIQGQMEGQHGGENVQAQGSTSLLLLLKEVSL